MASCAWSVFCELLLIVVVAVYIPATRSCSEPKGGYQEPTLEEKFHFADVMVYGVPMKHTPDPMVNSGYSVEFQVFCVFKGHPMKQNITINRAGYYPGLCDNYKMELNVPILAYLSMDQDTGMMTPIYLEDKADKQYLDEVMAICDINVNYPADSRSRKPGTCPKKTEDDHGDCIRYQVTTPKIPPIVSGKMESPPPPPLPEDKQRDGSGTPGKDKSEADGGPGNAIPGEDKVRPYGESENATPSDGKSEPSVYDNNSPALSASLGVLTSAAVVVVVAVVIL